MGGRNLCSVLCKRLAERRLLPVLLIAVGVASLCSVFCVLSFPIVLSSTACYPITFLLSCLCRSSLIRLSGASYYPQLLKRW